MKAVLENLEGKGPVQIFREAGFDLGIIGIKKALSAVRRWEKTYETHGEKGFSEEHRGKGSTGRPRTEDGNLHPEAMIHSDQGVHYTDPEYQQLVKEMGLKQSISRRGNCLDNAPMESFFGHLKDEVDYKEAESLAELHTLVMDYMNHYNNTRNNGH